MKEKVQTRERPKEQVKLTKLRASIHRNFEVFAFTTPQVQVEEGNQESKETKLDRMEVEEKEPT